MRFSNWLDTFLDEKGFDKNHIFEHETENDFHMVDAGCLIDFLKNLDHETQTKIKNTLVQIDFKNGDYMHFLNYLSNGMVQQNYGGIKNDNKYRDGNN